MLINNLNAFDFLRGDYDCYIVIGVSSTYTVEVFNVSTWEEETLEGDYLNKGDISHLNLIGNTEDYLHSLDARASEYKQRLMDKVNELKLYYYG